MVKVERVDTARFDATFKEYVMFTKRSIHELITKTAYFVARNCVMTTKYAPKDKIKESVLQASRISGTARIADILVNKIRGSNGEKGLYGNKMRVAGNKFATKAASGSSHLRAGWIWAIKGLEASVPNKGGAPRYDKVKAVGQVKGGSKTTGIVNPSWLAKAEIWNSVQGGFKKWKNAPRRQVEKVQAIIQQGLQLALNKEEQNKRAYIEKKMNDNAQKFNRA